MSSLSERFPKKSTIFGTTMFLNEYNRIYIPKNKEGFEKTIDALFSLLPDPNDEQKKNYMLIKKYPFILPKNNFDLGLSNDYNFNYTILDHMPNGWRTKFGAKLLKELKEAILEYKEDFLYEYFVSQVKEKWGGLRWYDYGSTERMRKVLDKYSKISYKICIVCGKKGKIDKGYSWVMPLCRRHRKARKRG